MVKFSGEKGSVRVSRFGVLVDIQKEHDECSPPLPLKILHLKITLDPSCLEILRKWYSTKYHLPNKVF